jgi:hypothetical protein
MPAGRAVFMNGRQSVNTYMSSRFARIFAMTPHGTSRYLIGSAVLSAPRDLAITVYKEH